jgi:hypothetical protein
VFLTNPFIRQAPRTEHPFWAAYVVISLEPMTVNGGSEHARRIHAEIAADARQAQVRLTERGRAIHSPVGVKRSDRLYIALRPGPRPGIRPARAAISESMPVIQAERHGLQVRPSDP